MITASPRTLTHYLSDFRLDIVVLPVIDAPSALLLQISIVSFAAIRANGKFNAAEASIN